MTADPYAELGVPREASKADIRRAYRKRAARAHPDRPGGSAERMTALNAAYALLSDDSARSRFDRCGDALPPEQSLDLEATTLLSSLFFAALDNEEYGDADLVAAVARCVRQKLSEARVAIVKLRLDLARDQRRAGKLRYRQQRTSHDFLRHLLEQRIAASRATLERGARFLETADRALQLLGDFSWDRGEEDNALMQRHGSLFRALQGDNT